MWDIESELAAGRQHAFLAEAEHDRLAREVIHTNARQGSSATRLVAALGAIRSVIAHTPPRAASHPLQSS